MSGGLFIDLDGTLADSLAVMRAVYDRFLRDFGKAGSDAEFDRLNGPRLPDIVADLAATHALGLPVPELLQRYLALVGEIYLDVAPDPAAGSLLQSARDVGLTVAVVTSNSAALAQAWLRRVGLAGLVHTVVGGEDVSRGKPDPEPYLLALARTGCDATLSYAIEDSPGGARAAMAAGLRTFFLAHSPATPPPGTVSVKTLAEVTPLVQKREWLAQVCR